MLVSLGRWVHVAITHVKAQNGLVNQNISYIYYRIPNRRITLVYESIYGSKGKEYLRGYRSVEDKKVYNVNEPSKKDSEYKTKEGETIPFTSLAEQGELDFSGEPEVQREGSKEQANNY